MQKERNNILVPRNLEDRKEKLKQKNYKMLQQEIIRGYIEIDDTWDFCDVDFKCTKIIGNINVRSDIKKLPKWLANITLHGNFRCPIRNLETLNNLPKEITHNAYLSLYYTHATIQQEEDSIRLTYAIREKCKIIGDIY